jgi:hypothetical protein
MNGTRGLSAWRWLFIIEGGVTVFIAGFGYFVLPNFPRTTSWLTEEERQLAAWRLEEDIGQDDWIDSQHQTFGHGLKLAFTDPKMYILVCALFRPNCIHFYSSSWILDGHALLHRRLRHCYEFLSHRRPNSRL